MEEARRVLARLRSIESLDRHGAAVPVIVAELRELALELERWLAVEPAARESVVPALDRCRRALDGVPVEVVPVN
jgi:hypothetical protein